MVLKLVHKIILTVFCKADDDEKLLVDAINNFVNLDLDNEKLQIVSTEALIEPGVTISIITFTLEKQRHTKHFIDVLNQKLNVEQKQTLISQDNRLDEACNFFIRFDKTKFLDGVLELVDHGDCFHFKFVMAAYPKNKDNAKELVMEMINLN